GVEVPAPGTDERLGGARLFGPVRARACSSVVEHRTFNPRVEGSIPSGPTLVSVISDSRKDRSGANVVPGSTLLCIMRSGPVAAARARSLVPWRSSLRWRSAHSSTSVPFPRLLSLLVGVVPVKRDDGAERRHRGRERTRVGGEHDRHHDAKRGSAWTALPPSRPSPPTTGSTGRPPRHPLPTPDTSKGRSSAARACALGAALRGPGLVGSGLDAVAAHLGDLRGLRGAGEPEGMAEAHPPRDHLLGGLRAVVGAGTDQRPARVIGEPFGNSSCLARGPLRGELAHDGDAGRLAAVARTCDLHECSFIDPVGAVGASGPGLWAPSSSVAPGGGRHRQSTPRARESTPRARAWS